MFKNRIITAIAALILLTGCSQNSTNQTAGANAGGGNAQGQQQERAAGQGTGRSPMMDADVMGKIKSIDGETITLYKSSFVPGSRGGGGEGSPPPQGEGQGQNRPDMTEMFSGETVDVQVTAATKIIKMTFENQERKETEIALADLKADDILSVDLEENTQNAITITLSEGGGFGGMGGMGGGGRRGQDQRQSSGN